MSDLIYPSEINDLFDGLVEAANKIFGDRLDLPYFTQHNISSKTASERYDLNYFAGNIGATSLGGLFTIVEWTPTGDEVAPSIEDTESDYGSEVILVDRNTYSFDFGNRSFVKSRELLKCIPGEEELYDSVEETSFTYSRGMGDENLDDLSLSELVDIETATITVEDREAVARILSLHGVLLF